VVDEASESFDPAMVRDALTVLLYRDEVQLSEDRKLSAARSSLAAEQSVTTPTVDERSADREYEP
jgi:hypothetical protein